MARKDDILRNFLKHKIIQDKYELSSNELPNTVQEALKSEKVIIRAVALIVENLESNAAITDASLRSLITQYLDKSEI